MPSNFDAAIKDLLDQFTEALNSPIKLNNALQIEVVLHNPCLNSFANYWRPEEWVLEFETVTDCS